MKKSAFLYIICLYLSLVSCNGKNQENTSLTNDTTISGSTDPEASEDLVADSLKSGPGTKSSTPAAPTTGTSTSENGLSTDVGGVVPRDTARNK